MKNIELLAPAGSMEKLKTAFYFGADAAYVGGKDFSLRAMADNFTAAELENAIGYAHSLGKKVYVTCNIFAFNQDIPRMTSYFQTLEELRADGVIVSDLGAAVQCVKHAPRLELHISTQANTTNKYSCKAWQELGAKRVVLAREVPLSQIKEIKDYLPTLELEVFVHGAMCVAYSGRCLLSNALTNRSGNRGECVQACRWKYQINEVSRKERLDIMEDERGTYILNSKDLNMLAHLSALKNAGIDSLKIEGRMKTAYYVATVVNAYKRALNGESVAELEGELYKTSHRSYATGFFFGGENNVNLADSRTVQEYDFVARVVRREGECVVIEQRNKFQVGDVLEVLSPNSVFNETFRVESLKTLSKEDVEVANKVQQHLLLSTHLQLGEGDILRKKIV